MSRFSRTVMRGKQWRPSGESAIPRATISCGGANVMSSPPKRIRPALAGVSPLIARRVVDLPAPLEPIRVTISPSCTSSETPFSASIAP